MYLRTLYSKMKLIFITANPEHASTADKAGVDRVMVDLEILGKEARQGHLDTVISHHTLDDVAAVKRVLKAAELLVRVNPVHAGSAAEIDAVIAAGAQRLMLPMFRHPKDVGTFLDIVDGRLPTVLLLETSTALARLPQILEIPGVEEIHIGLNDLHLELQLDFMFELFPSGLLDHVAAQMLGANIPFGVGGVARLGQGILPAELILSEHTRLGSSAVILSRDFVQALNVEGAFAAEVARLRAHVDELSKASPQSLEAARRKVAKGALDIAETLRARRSLNGKKQTP